MLWSARTCRHKGWSEGLGTPVMSAIEVMAVLRSFGMGKFAAAVMWVLNEVFVGVNENENCPQINTDGHGCPQADGRSEREFTRIYSHIANIKKSSPSSASFREFKAIGPQADVGCDD